jgi:hypothetical protein
LEAAEVNELCLLFKRTNGESFRQLTQSDLMARVATKSPPLDVEVAQLLWQQISKERTSTPPSSPTATPTPTSANIPPTPSPVAAAPVSTPVVALPLPPSSSAFGKASVTRLVVQAEGKFVPKVDEVTHASGHTCRLG